MPFFGPPRWSTRWRRYSFRSSPGPELAASRRFFADIFLCLATVGLILPNATAAVMAPFPEQAGVASALLGMLQFSVGAATGALVGFFHDGTPRPMAFTMAGCAAISLIITVSSERRKRNPHGSPAV